LSLVILVIIAIQAYIYHRQWEVMQGQKRITTIAERAYLGIKDVKIINPIQKDTLVIYAVVFNGGRTPALKVERKLQIGMVAKPTPFDWDSCPERSDFSVFPASVERR